MTPAIASYLRRLELVPGAEKIAANLRGHLENVSANIATAERQRDAAREDLRRFDAWADAWSEQHERELEAAIEAVQPDVRPLLEQKLADLLAAFEPPPRPEVG